jgi:hypothetical protein
MTDADDRFDFGDSPNPWPNERPQHSLRAVATGLMIILASLTIIVLSMIGAIATVIQMRGQGPIPQIPIMLGWAVLAAYLLNIVGTLVCLATPAITGATNWLYGSVCFMLAAVSISLVGRFFDDLSPSLREIQQPAWIVSSIFFVLYLQRLAKYLGSHQLVTQARRTLRAGILLLVLMMVQLALTQKLFADIAQFGGQRNAPGVPQFAMVAGIVGLATLIVGAVALIRYVNLLIGIRNAIRSPGQTE